MQAGGVSIAKGTVHKQQQVSSEEAPADTVLAVCIFCAGDIQVVDDIVLAVFA